MHTFLDYIMGGCQISFTVKRSPISRPHPTPPHPRPRDGLRKREGPNPCQLQEARVPLPLIGHLVYLESNSLLNYEAT